MRVRLKLFFALTAWAGAVASPAIGQGTAPAVATSGGAAQSAASIPDFSGIWAHPGLGFGPPALGARPGQKQIAAALRREQFRSAGRRLHQSDPQARGRGGGQEARRNLIVGPGLSGPGQQCLQNPLPYIFWNFDVQLLQQPDKVTLIYEHDNDFREVRLNQPHPAKVIPSVHGDSVGHYEGDTLVIDTVGVRLGPYRMIDRFGTPYTQALHVVERYRLIDYEATKEAIARAEKEWPRAGGTVDPNYRGKGLQLEFTVEDPGVFTMPWSATITYGRGASPWEERVCAENVQHDYQLTTSFPTRTRICRPPTSRTSDRSAPRMHSRKALVVCRA